MTPVRHALRTRRVSSATWLTTMPAVPYQNQRRRSRSRPIRRRGQPDASASAPLARYQTAPIGVGQLGEQLELPYTRSSAARPAGAVLADHHREALARSGSILERAASRGYETIADKRYLAEIKVTAAGRNIPGSAGAAARRPRVDVGLSVPAGHPADVQQRRSDREIRDAHRSAQRARCPARCRCAARRSRDPVVRHRGVEESGLRCGARALLRGAGGRVELRAAPTTSAARWRCPTGMTSRLTIAE